MAVVVYQKRFGRFDWGGLSTDPKPTIGGYGSTFYEEDTGDYHLYGYSGWVIDTRGQADTDLIVDK